MISLSWDAFIVLFFIIATVYGFVLQKDKLTVVLFSTYAALAVANIWSESVYSALSEKGQVLGPWASNASLFTISAGLFILFIIILSSRSGLSADSEAGSIYAPFILAFLGFLTAGLILASIISFMPEGARENLIVSSRMAALVWKYYVWWIVLPALVLVLQSVFRNSKLKSRLQRLFRRFRKPDS